MFARDVDVVNTLTRSLRAGTVWTNCYNVFDSAVPFGGYKQSGIGRDKGSCECIWKGAAAALMPSHLLITSLCRCSGALHAGQVSVPAT